MAQTQTPAKKVQAGEIIKDPSSTTRYPGDVVLLGTIPLIVTPTDPNQPGLNNLDTEGVYDVPKDSSTFTAGDAVYWNASGNPVTGTAGTGAASSTPSAYLMGVVVLDAATGDSYVRVKLTAAKRTTTIAGSVTADDITGSDASLGIAGNAPATVTSAGGAVAISGGIGGATSGAGGAVSSTGGAGTAGNSAGGAVSSTGGAGQGSAAGGVSKIVGGVGGATGAGGAAQVTGGAGGATSGTGGAVTIAAGAGSAGNANGGSLSIDAGAKNGSGTDGAITIGTNNAASITLGKMPRIPTATVAAAGSAQGDAAAVTEGFTLVTAADATKGVVLPSAVAGMQVIIKNADAANAILKIYPAASDAINALSANAALSIAAKTSVLLVAYDATTWYSLPLLAS